MAESKKIKECIAARLKAAREQAGLSQGQVAGILKVHRPTISEMEAGRRNVTAEELNKLSSIYDVRIGWLACEDTDESNSQKDKMYLAARKLSSMSEGDLDDLFNILKTMKKEKSS